MPDEILQEIRKTRDDFALRHNFDVKAMVAELQQLDRQGDWQIIRLNAANPLGEQTPAADTIVPTVDCR